MIEYIKKCWNGQENLAIIFVLYGILGTTLISIIGDYLEPFNTLWNIPFNLFTIAYLIWINVSIWNSSKKYVLIIKVIVRSPVFLTIGVLVFIFVLYILNIFDVSPHIRIRIPTL